ncbi:hypothetical protein [Methanoculleus chikugoensis]|uniref:hypothetical protein n=1 Tax=Methanoculleus chikugoensis TaxID=118126 RepID=UPI0015C1B6FC|nr:hypothetical protein [Methanoculleus chikugoensis]MDD4566373.1 hypothetical protein [Methanoculleus chikugoensis]NMA09490.1 hypothetical protein [Methanomicrobiales archaeon]
MDATVAGIAPVDDKHPASAPAESPGSGTRQETEREEHELTRPGNTRIGRAAIGRAER